MTYLKDRRVWIGIVLVVCAGMIAAVASTAKAETIPTKQAAKPAPAAPAAVSSWTGFGVDVHGSLPTAPADFGAPIDISMSGQMAGLGVYYNHQFGAIVLGLDAAYDRVWGDLHSYGVDYAVSIGVRAGVLASSSTLIYARGEWLRAVGSGDHIDGWGLGGGIEVRIKDAPVSVALEYMHDWMDKDAFGPSVDVTADRVTARVKFDLYSKPVRSIFVD